MAVKLRVVYCYVNIVTISWESYRAEKKLYTLFSNLAHKGAGILIETLVVVDTGTLANTLGNS